MNLEARTMSKGLWWDGYYGGVCKDSKFAMLYHKPNISAVIAEYDAVSCYPKAGPDANTVVVKGVTRALNQAEISGIDAMIDTVFPDTGGGGGGGSSGEADVAHRVRVFGMSGKEGNGAQVVRFPADALNKTYVIEMGGFEGTISNVTRNTVEDYFTLPIMVNAYITYNGFITSSATIVWADKDTHVLFNVEVFTRLSGTAWPSAPASSEIVRLGEGDSKNVQFYSKQWIEANMVGSQDVQMRITPISAPAGFDMTSVTFGKVGWGTTYSLTSCAAKNPDLVSF